MDKTDDGLELEPTDEMMGMSSTTAIENDPELLDMVLSDAGNSYEQEQQEQQEEQQQEPQQEPQQEKQQEPPQQQLQIEEVARAPISTVRPKITTADEEEEEDDDEDLEDETLFERIVALKEMFPESVRNAAVQINQTMVSSVKLAFTKGRTASWWLTSTMCVLVFPILIQKELLQVAEQISREQRSILLGPQAATGPISGAAF